MRVVALGGGGAMGPSPPASPPPCPPSHPSSWPTATWPQRRATVARAGAEDRPVRPRQVDISDPASLQALVADADVVLNTVGPFTRFGPTVLEAAIGSRTHYVDICDDPEPTVAMLALHERARAAGVTAIVGMGASPGLSNLLAGLAAGRLDELQDLHTAWPVDVGDGSDADPVVGPDGRPSAAAVHWMEQICGVVPAVTGGAVADRQALQPVSLRLPGNRGDTAYAVGHPEPLTLHARYSPTGEAACLMVVTPATVAFLDGLRDHRPAGARSPAQTCGC